MTEVIKLERTADFEETRGVAVSVGPMVIETPHGQVMVLDAPGLTTTKIERPGVPTSIALIVYDPEPVPDLGNLGTALLAQLDPEIARAIAASLLRLANEIDGRKPS